MEEYKIEHVIIKHVDETTNYRHFFRLSKRPKGMFYMRFHFHYKDEVRKPFEMQIEVPALTLDQKADRRKGRETALSLYLDIPFGNEVEKIFFATVHGVLGLKRSAGGQIQMSERPIEDVVLEDKIWKLKLGL